MAIRAVPGQSLVVFSLRSRRCSYRRRLSCLASHSTSPSLILVGRFWVTAEEQVSSATPDPAFCDTVLPRAAKRSADRLASQACNRRNHIRSELCVAIEQKKSVRRDVRPSLPQLLNDPESVGISGHVETQNLSPVVADHKEAIQNAKRERRHGEEVHGRNCLAMVSQERQPAFGGIWSSRDSSKPSRDRGFRQNEAQLEQFAMNARCSPGWVLSRHAKDQSTNFSAQPSSSSHSPGP